MSEEKYERSVRLTTGLERLLPCPHCGKIGPVRVARASEDEYWDSSNEDSFVIVCDASSFLGKGPGGCGAQAGFALTEDVAVENWNMRSNVELTGAKRPVE